MPLQQDVPKRPLLPKEVFVTLQAFVLSYYEPFFIMTIPIVMREISISIPAAHPASLFISNLFSSILYVYSAC